jgi:hypothetical protein
VPDALVGEGIEALELLRHAVDLRGDGGRVGVLGYAVALQPGVGFDLDETDRRGILALDAEP